MDAWKVEIQRLGRGSRIVYSEGPDRLVLDSEVGGGDVRFIIFGSPPQDWDSQVSWAQGRRKEIMERVASEVIRQEFPKRRAEFGDDYCTILIR
jgi:hypothetical protein